MPDAHFAEPRLAELYDPLDADRSDLDVYVAMADEFGVRSVLDVGCGTGTLACLLASRGLQVTAADPALASLEVARRKPGADRVRWLHADAASLPPLQVDLAVMTGNVAQVFVSDQEWAAALGAIRQALRPAWPVFEARDPAMKAWLEWTRDQTWRRVAVPGAPCPDLDRSDRGWAGPGQLPDDLRLRARWRDADLALHLAVPGPRRTRRFAGRGRPTVEEVRDAPDRPGREFVFITRRTA